MALAGCGGGSGGTGSEAPGGATGCNGSAALCGKRLDQVVFPGTHNSYAASAEPGWHFASQRFAIPRQLKDGITALLLDVHYGVAEPGGDLVRTDFAAEGADANKVAAAIPDRERAGRRTARRAFSAWDCPTRSRASTSATRCVSSGPSRSGAN